jgi:hypothetical protein
VLLVFESDAFRTKNGFDLTAESFENPPSAASGVEASTIGTIAGAAAGGLLLIAIIFVLIARKRRNDNKHKPKPPPSHKTIDGNADDAIQF